MKKIFYLIIDCLFFVIFFISCEKSYMKLSTDEKFELEYVDESRAYNVYIVSSKDKKKYCTFEDSIWGGYDISKDSKKMILFKENHAGRKPMYFFDGENGKITYVGDFSCGSKIDQTGNYLLYEVEYNTGLFSIINLNTFEREFDFQIPIKKIEEWTRRGAAFDISRSNDNTEYDFCIEFNIELRSIAKTYFNVSKKKGFVEYDDSELKEVQLRSRM